MGKRAFVVTEAGHGEDSLDVVLRDGHLVESITVIGTSALVITHGMSPPNEQVKRPEQAAERGQTMNSANDVKKPEPAACSGPLEPLVGHSSSCLPLNENVVIDAGTVRLRDIPGMLAKPAGDFVFFDMNGTDRERFEEMLTSRRHSEKRDPAST